MPQPNALRVVVWITLSSSLLGALFAYAENRPHGIADLVNTELNGVLVFRQLTVEGFPLREPQDHVRI